MVNPYGEHFFVIASHLYAAKVAVVAPMGPDSHFLDFSLPLQWLTLTDVHGWCVVPWRPSVNQRQATRGRFGLVSLDRAGENLPLLAWALCRGQLLAWQIKRFVALLKAADQETLLQALLRDHPQRDVYLAPQPEPQVPEPMEELTKVALQEMDGDNLQSFRPEKERYLGTLGETGAATTRAARGAGLGSASVGGPSTAPPGPSAGGLQEDGVSALAGEGEAARGERPADGEGAPGNAVGMPAEPTPLLASNPVPRRDPLRSNVSWMEPLLPQEVPETVEACRCNRVARQNCWTARYVVRLPAGAQVPEGFDAQLTKSRSWVPGGRPRGQRIAATGGTEHEAAQLVLQWLWAKHCAWSTSTMPEATRRFLEPCPGCSADCPVLAGLAQGAVAEAVPRAGPQPGAGRGRQRRSKAGPQPEAGPEPGAGRGRPLSSKRAAATGPQRADPSRVDQEVLPAAAATKLARQPDTVDRPVGPVASPAPAGSSSPGSSSDSDSSSADSGSAVEQGGAASSALPPAAARAPGVSKATPSTRAPNAARAPLLPPADVPAGAAAAAPSPAAQPATRRRGLASAAAATTAAPTSALDPDDVPLSHYLHKTSAAAAGRSSRSSLPARPGKRGPRRPH